MSMTGSSGQPIASDRHMDVDQSREETRGLQTAAGKRTVGGAMLTLLFDGLAYGMLLFVLSCGLAVTLGLMNFVNLAHGAFAMAGGYVTILLMDRGGWPFL